MNHPTYPITRRLSYFLLVSLITLLALSLPLAVRAQSGGPGTDHGTVTSIDDRLLDIRGGDGTGTRTYQTADDTQWLDKNGQPIDPGDVVDKKVAVRIQFVTGGLKALSVQITSGGGSPRPARSEDAGDASSSRHHWPEQVLRGTIGNSEAVFRLKWSDDEKRVSGTYSQGGKTYRIEGTGKPGHMSLDEYTGERLTAHIKLTLDDLETTWSGTMYNVYPDKSQYPVSVSKSH
jgi:hypothetical protein